MSNSKPLQSVYGFDANNNQIINVAAPTAPTDAVTLEYFDAHAAPNEFTQDGTGAVTRPLSYKLNDFVSVKDFGAIGDSMTDDTIAIRTADLWCSQNGFTLYFPRGVYRISDGIESFADFL